MREIEFRGKSSTSGEWLYGSLIKINGHYHIISNNDFEEDGHHLHQISDTPTWVDEDTIGEFTGRYDNSHNKIYEGDIFDVKCGGEHRIGFVTLNNGEWAIEIDFPSFDYTSYISLFDEDNCHIIGNIHDNEELLTINDNGK